MLMLNLIYKFRRGLIILAMLFLPLFLVSGLVSATDSTSARSSLIALEDGDDDDVTSSDDGEEKNDDIQPLPEALESPTPNNDGSVETTFFGNFKDDGSGCGIFNLLNFIIDILTFGIGVAAIIGIVVCGINYLTAKGNVNQTAKAKHRFVQIVIGLALYATLWALLNFLLPAGKLNNNTPCSTDYTSNSRFGTQEPWTSNYPDSIYHNNASDNVNFDDDEDYPDTGEITTSFVKLVVADVGATANLNAKAESGSPVTFKSSNSSIVSVNSKGEIKAKKPGLAKITLTAKAKDGNGNATKTVGIVVPKIRDRVAALAPWRDILVDTFSHINGRTYSFGSPCKWWGSNNNWSGKTGKSGSTQSCLTLPVVSMKRMGYMGKKAKCFWFSDGNVGSKPNSTVRNLKKNSKYLKISYPHKSFKSLANSGKLEYGDVVVRSGHIYVYMGKKKGSHKIYQGGTTREVSRDTRVVWGHYSGGVAKPITSEIRKQIKKSDNVLSKYKNNKAHFTGSNAKGTNLNAKIHIVGHVKTFTVKTVCVNGSITNSNLYAANRTVTINYKPVSGKTLSYIKVDGTKISGHKSSYTFNHLSGNHTIKVVYK